MKRIFFSFSIVLAITTLFNSCTTEFDVAAPYKEIPIVVGLLNKSDSIHYIKINKAYLNKEGSAYLAGSVSDSNLYPYPLNVKLYAVDPLTKVRVDSVSLDTTRIAKTSGNFQSNDVVYRTPAYKLKFKSPSSDTTWYDYEVVVRRASDNKLIASAECGIVGDIRYKKAPNEINLYNLFPTTSAPEYKSQLISWRAAKNGRRYSVLLRFRFAVVNDGLGINYMDSVDIQLMSNNRNNSSDGQGEISYSLSGETFYRKLQIALDALPFGYRREYRGPLEFHFEYAGEELDTYMEINNSSVSLSEVVPEFTNINGGLGIFSSRVRKKFADIRQTGLSLSTIEGLKTNGIVGRKAPQFGNEDLGFY